MISKAPNVFIFYGRSGCGKGTQAALLSKILKKTNRKVIVVETGKTFRQFIHMDNYAAKTVKKIVESGGLPQAFLPIWFWTNILIKKFTGQQDLILDGVCRRMEEGVILASLFEFFKLNKINLILINVSRKWSLDRLLSRNRHDDTLEKINSRLDWYEDHTVKAINYFKNLTHCNFIEINGEQSIEQVHKDVIRALKIPLNKKK